MEVKEVVRIAKSHIADVFSDETPDNIGLEEVTFNEGDDCWSVTVGFSRPWDRQTSGVVVGLQPKQATRQLKVVKVSNKDGKVVAIKIRE